MFGNGESFIKIGITTDTISNRFIRLHKYGYKYNIIIAQRLDSIDAFSKEKCLHKKYREQKYIPKIKYPGYTESFNINIISDFQI